MKTVPDREVLRRLDLDAEAPCKHGDMLRVCPPCVAEARERWARRERRVAVDRALDGLRGAP